MTHRSPQMILDSQYQNATSRSDSASSARSSSIKTLAITWRSHSIVMRKFAASRGAAAPSRHRRDSSPGEEVVAGFFFEFEAVRTDSGPKRVSERQRSRRWRLHETAPPRRRRRDPTRVYVVVMTPSTRCHIGPSRATAMLRAGIGRASSWSPVCSWVLLVRRTPPTRRHITAMLRAGHPGLPLRAARQPR